LYNHIPESTEEYSAQQYGMKTDRTPFGRPDAGESHLTEEAVRQPPYMEEPEFTRMEKLSAMMGAIAAALSIGAVYAVGLGIIILLMVLFWK